MKAASEADILGLMFDEWLTLFESRIDFPQLNLVACWFHADSFIAGIFTIEWLLDCSDIFRDCLLYEMANVSYD